MKTVRETAAMLGYDESHVRRLCIEGKLKGKKLGWMWVISEEAIKRYQRQCKGKRPASQITP
jgi:excisionase family DNA binding protein